jgi:hypothetical protein
MLWPGPQRTCSTRRLAVPGPMETQSSPVHRPQAADHHHVPRVPHRHRLRAPTAVQRGRTRFPGKKEGTVIGDRLAADTAPANAADESVRPSASLRNRRLVRRHFAYAAPDRTQHESSSARELAFARRREPWLIQTPTLRELGSRCRPTDEQLSSHRSQFIDQSRELRARRSSAEDGVRATPWLARLQKPRSKIADACPLATHVACDGAARHGASWVFGACS